MGWSPRETCRSKHIPIIEVFCSGTRSRLTIYVTRHCSGRLMQHLADAGPKARSAIHRQSSTSALMMRGLERAQGTLLRWSEMAKGWRHTVWCMVRLLALAGCRTSEPTEARPALPGQVAWLVSTVQSPLAAGEIAVDSDKVFVYSSLTSVSAIRLSDRQIVWRASADDTSAVGSSPKGIASCSGRVVFGSSAWAYAVSADSGVRQWRWRPSQGGTLTFSAPVCVDGVVYFTTGRPMYAYAVDAMTGVEKWAVNLGRVSSGNGFVATPRIVDGILVACTREFGAPNTGMIAGVDAATGTERWRHEWFALAPSTESSCAVSVAAADGIAVGAADDGRVFGLDLRTGALRWTIPPVAGFVSPRDERPVWIVDDVVMVGSGSSIIGGYALRSGAPLWTFGERTPGRSPATFLVRPIAGDHGQFIAVNSSGGAIAVEAATGRRQWMFQSAGDGSTGLLFPKGVLTATLFIAIAPDGVYAIRR